MTNRVRVKEKFPTLDLGAPSDLNLSLFATPTISREMTPVAASPTKPSQKPKLNSVNIIDLEHRYGAHKRVIPISSSSTVLMKVGM